METQEERRGLSFLQDVTLDTVLAFALNQKMGQVFKGLCALAK